MNLIPAAIRSLFAPRHERRRTHLERSISAALPGIATSDMLRMVGSADQTIRAHLTKLRSQSRALALNSDYVKSFLRMVEHHVVGPEGVKLQNKARDPKPNGDPHGPLDTVANRIVEKAFEVWSKPTNCDVRGKLSFRAYQKHVIRTVARDGECFVRLVGNFKNSKHRFGLQMIPAELVDETYWDDRLNIKCGIQHDEYGRPEYYFIRQDGTQETNLVHGINGRSYVKIPAAEMVHFYLMEFPEQSRGIPWMHTALIRLHQLGAYEEAEVMAARIGASKMGFVTSPTGSGAALADGEDDYGRISQTVTPGSIDVLPDGYTFTPFDPTHPSGNFGPFIKSTLRGISAGLGVAYNGLANDLEGVNYSSIRAGLIEEREMWKALHREMREQFLEKVFPAWIDHADLTGALKPLPSSKLEKFSAPVWQFRGWAWVDPQKDIDASVTAIGNGLRTRTKVLAEQGEDFEDVLIQLKEEQDLIKEYGVEVLPFGKSSAPPASAPQEQPVSAEA